MRAVFYAVPVRHVCAAGLTTLLLIALSASLVFGRIDHSPRHSRLKVAVDAGHGGSDIGAWYPQFGLVEKDINLSVAKTLVRQLEDQGFSAFLIRDDDVYIELGERADLANRARADIFVSIHVNRFPQDTRCRGAQAFYQRGSAYGQQLAVFVQEELRKVAPTNDRKAIAADFKVLRETHMPGVLVEIGFATNAHDRQLIMDPGYRNAVAAAICRAIVRYRENGLSTDNRAQRSPGWSQRPCSA